eukprot:TRINITY_DN36116_c0_g1_i1.p1 TRINITY_DN36116_c0_g1~~TRINITY_DN36116_c0_g1_i1.p1  ORF type:complete len:313 (+),score=72.17 TRINITY_DN36116_c0_g1_i1:67-939(+)
MSTAPAASEPRFARPPQCFYIALVPIAVCTATSLLWVGIRVVTAYSGEWSAAGDCTAAGVGASVDVHVAAKCLEPDACTVGVVTRIHKWLVFTWESGEGIWSPDDTLFDDMYANEGTPDAWTEMPLSPGLQIFDASGLSWPGLADITSSYLNISGDCGAAALNARCGTSHVLTPPSSLLRGMVVVGTGVRPASRTLIRVGQRRPCWYRLPGGKLTVVAPYPPAAAFRSGTESAAVGVVLCIGVLVVGCLWMHPASPFCRIRAEVAAAGLEMTRACLVPQELRPLLASDEA